MRDWRRRAGSISVALALLWGLPQLPAAAQSADSPPAVARTANLAVIAHFSARCPDLRRADTGDETVAIVVFRVGVTGLPSHASISASSHSASLDAAATGCIMKLRFQPATRAGDGEAVASWQQMALRWLRSSARDAAPTSAAPAPASAPSSMSAPLPGAAAPPPHAPPTAGARVDVCVCVDGTGTLAQQPTVARSSGDAQFDAAALRIAQSASGSYRPATRLDPASTSDCTPLTLSIEQR
jgi:outer membrane biosynthesis protein TonB